MGETEAGVVRPDELFWPVTGEVSGDTRGLRRPNPDVVGNGAGTKISAGGASDDAGGEGGGVGDVRSVYFDGCSGSCSGNEGSLGQAPNDAIFSPPEFNSNRKSDERPLMDEMGSNPRALKEPAKELFDAR